MDQSTKESLVKAIELLKAGKTSEAAALLANVLKNEPELVQGWYLLGLALDDEEKKIRAFKKVLKLDPNHEKAKQQLEKLEDFSTQVEQPSFETEPPPSSTSIVDDEFELPDWMQEPTFDPSDYAAEIPQITDAMNQDIPDWVQQSPLVPTDEESQTNILPPAPKESEQIESESPPEAVGPEPPEMELTGYYEDVEDQEAAAIDWGDGQFAEDSAKQEQVSAFFDEEAQLDDQTQDQTDQPEWLRDMVEDDGGKKKRKKKEKVPKKLLSPDQKRRRRKIITYIVVILAVIGIGYAGYTYRDQIKPVVDPYLSPILTKAAPVTDLLTQGAPLTVLLTPGFNITPTITSTPPLQPTPEPTWTPSGNQAPVSTQGSNQAAPGPATITPTPLPLDEGMVAEMESVEEQVRTVRGLPGPLNVDREILPNYRLQQIMAGTLIDDDVLAQLETEEIVLRALGFINDTYDLTLATINSRADALGGFYDPTLNKIYLVGEDFQGVEQYIYAHEYAHTLQDANFDLNSLGLYPTCTKPSQACLAIRALVEGEATLVDQQWLEQYPPEVGSEEISNYEPPARLFQDGAEPAYFAMNTSFAVDYGLSFVNYLYENGGWKAVNRAYGVLPETTEQVLHPTKYQQRELPLYLNHPDLSPVFRNDWEFIRSDSLGEWGTYLLLAYNDFTDARRPVQEARVAAEGWGADEFRVYHNSATNKVFLSAYWIWDTPADINQFYTSLLPYVSTRFGSNVVDGPGEEGVCWSYVGQISCLYKNDTGVLWLYSDDQEILAAAKERFTKFP